MPTTIYLFGALRSKGFQVELLLGLRNLASETERGNGRAKKDSSCNLLSALHVQHMDQIRLFAIAHELQRGKARSHTSQRHNVTSQRHSVTTSQRHKAKRAVVMVDEVQEPNLSKVLHEKSRVLCRAL